MTYHATKVFGIGLPKTATTSLEMAFEDLGYRKQGYSLECLNEFLNNGFSQRIKDTIDRYDAFADWPWSLMYMDLFLEFGRDAKYILTRRKSPEIWVDSMKRHSVTTQTSNIRQSVYGIHCPHGYEPHLLSQYDHHNRSVIQFFDQQGALDCLLDLRIGAENDWEHFTEFLGQPSRNGCFRHSNRSEDRELDVQTVFHNLKLINQARRGLEKPELTLDEALLNVPGPAWRNARQGQAIRMHAKAATELDRIAKRHHRRKGRADRYWPVIRWALVPHEQSQEKALHDVAAPYVRACLAEIRSHGLFGTEAGRDWVEAEAELCREIIAIVSKGGMLPNLLFPQRHSEFVLLENVLFERPMVEPGNCGVSKPIRFHIFEGRLGFVIALDADGEPAEVYDSEMNPVVKNDPPLHGAARLSSEWLRELSVEAERYAGNSTHAEICCGVAAGASGDAKFGHVQSPGGLSSMPHAIDIKLGRLWPAGSALRRGLDTFYDSPSGPHQKTRIRQTARSQQSEVVSWSN